MTPEEIAKLLDEAEPEVVKITNPDKEIQFICEEMDKKPPEELPECIRPRSRPRPREVNDYQDFQAEITTRALLKIPSKSPTQRLVKLIPESGSIQFVNKGYTAPRSGQPIIPPQPAPAPQKTINAPRLLDL